MSASAHPLCGVEIEKARRAIPSAAAATAATATATTATGKAAAAQVSAVRSALLSKLAQLQATVATAATARAGVAAAGAGKPAAGSAPPADPVATAVAASTRTVLEELCAVFVQLGSPDVVRRAHAELGLSMVAAATRGAPVRCLVSQSVSACLHIVLLYVCIGCSTCVVLLRSNVLLCRTAA
jgi:hypothetical protein